VFFAFLLPIAPAVLVAIGAVVRIDIFVLFIFLLKIDCKMLFFFYHSDYRELRMLYVNDGS
jgi:hypothetical protein